MLIYVQKDEINDDMTSAFIHDVTDFLSSSAKVCMYVYDLFIYCTVISVHAPTLHVSYTLCSG